MKKSTAILLSICALLISFGSIFGDIMSTIMFATSAILATIALIIAIRKDNK